MTVIRPNSISGVTSITAQSQSIEFYKSDGNLSGANLDGVNTTTIAGTATSEGAVQVRGNIAITEGLLTLDSNLHTSVSVPTGKNAMLIGPTTVAVGATIDVAQGSTLVVV